MAVSTSWRNPKSIIKLKREISIYFIIGLEDSVKFVRSVAKKCQQEGRQVALGTFVGGHKAAPPALLKLAIHRLKSLKKFLDSTHCFRIISL